jgi:hypothetical protein
MPISDVHLTRTENAKTAEQIVGLAVAVTRSGPSPDMKAFEHQGVPEVQIEPYRDLAPASRRRVLTGVSVELRSRQESGRMSSGIMIFLRTGAHFLCTFGSVFAFFVQVQVDGVGCGRMISARSAGLPTLKRTERRGRAV